MRKKILLFFVFFTGFLNVFAQELEIVSTSMDSSMQLAQDPLGNYILLFSLDAEGNEVEGVQIPKGELKNVYSGIKEYIADDDAIIQDLGKFKIIGRDHPLELHVKRESELMGAFSLVFSLWTEDNSEYWEAFYSQSPEDIETLFLPVSNGLPYIGQYGTKNFYKIPLISFKKSELGQTGNFDFLPASKGDCMTFDREKYRFVKETSNCSGKATVWLPNYIPIRDDDYKYLLGVNFEMIFNPKKINYEFPVQIMLGNSPKGYYYITINDKGQAMVGVKRQEGFRDVWVSSEELVKFDQENNLKFQVLQDGQFSIQLNGQKTSTEELQKGAENANDGEFKLGDLPGVSNRIVTYTEMDIDYLHLGLMEFADPELQYLDPYNGLSQETLDKYAHATAVHRYKDEGKVISTDVVETIFKKVNVLGEEQIMLVSVIDVEVEGKQGSIKDQFSVTYKIVDLAHNSIEAVILSEKGPDGKMKVWQGPDFHNEVLGDLRDTGYIYGGNLHSPNSRM